MNYNYIAYEAENHKIEIFTTFKEAEEWLLECCNEYAEEDGYSEEAKCGQCFIAKITHATSYRVTNEKKNYGDDEEWPYSDELDSVGVLEMKEKK